MEGRTGYDIHTYNPKPGVLIGVPARSPVDSGDYFTKIGRVYAPEGGILSGESVFQLKDTRIPERNFDDNIDSFSFTRFFKELDPDERFYTPGGDIAQALLRLPVTARIHTIRYDKDPSEASRGWGKLDERYTDVSPEFFADQFFGFLQEVTIGRFRNGLGSQFNDWDFDTTGAFRCGFKYHMLYGEGTTDENGQEQFSFENNVGQLETTVGLLLAADRMAFMNSPDELVDYLKSLE